MFHNRIFKILSSIVLVLTLSAGQVAASPNKGNGYEPARTAESLRLSYDKANLYASDPYATKRDIVLVIDTSASMAYETSGYPFRSDPGDDPALCNASHTCQPLEAIKAAAIDFTDLLFFPGDQVSIVTMTSQTPDGSRTPVVVLPLTSDKSTIQTALANLNVFQPPNCNTLYGPCLRRCSASDVTNPTHPCYNSNVGDYWGQDCPVIYSSGDPSSCNSSDVGTSIKSAGNEISQGFARPDAQHIIVALVGGPANASVDESGTYPFGFCPPATWSSPVAPFCRDALSSTRHASTDPDYDAEDYARDMSDQVADLTTGAGAKIFTIGFGYLIQNAPKGDPDAGEKLLQYIALTAGGDNANHGAYYYAPDASSLQAIVQDIANITTIPPSEPSVNLVPAALDFGEQFIQTTSPAQTVTLTNSGTGNLIIGALAITSGFVLSNDLCSSHIISAAGTCTFDVVFSPLTSGVKSGTISIPSNASTSPDLVTLTGTGTAPAVSLSQFNSNFGVQLVGITSSARTITITNTGTADLNIGIISNTGEFIVSDDLCSSQTIAKANTCTFDMAFSPISIGPKNGLVTIPNNSSSSPNHISLYGRGITACSPAITVMNNNDNGAGTLRQAITDICTGGTITFDPSLSGGTIGLGVSTLTIDNNLNIDGSALALPITISGGWNGIGTSGVRVFSVLNNVSADLNSLIIANGFNMFLGGGAYNEGTLIITNSIFSNNVVNEFDVDLGSGGAIVNTGILIIAKSTFTNNYAAEKGSAIYNFGSATITNSTFSDNFSGYHGTIYNQGAVTITNSTFSGNSSSAGSDIHNRGVLNLYNTILANSIKDVNCYNSGGTVSGNNNLIEADGAGVNACGTTAPLNIDPQLGTLTGSPAYFPLNIGSPAIDAGDDAICAATPVNHTSQNGLTRPQGDHCDIGSFEFDKTPPIVLSIIRSTANPANTALINFTVTFSEAVTGVDASDFTLTTTGAISGMTVGLVSGSGTTYTVTVNTGSNNGSIRLDVADDNSIVDAASIQLGGTAISDGDFTAGAIYTIIKSATFADVPLSYWSNTSIERLYNAGITGGCSTTPQLYCPESPVTRAQMAVFLLRGIHGSSYSPPAVGVSTGFNDVPTDYWAAVWIKQLAAEGITGGCGVGLYCPETIVTRAQMAVFLLRAKYTSAYIPPIATGTFADVPMNYWSAGWIEQLAVEGITSGCGVGIYCPESNVTRAQMAVFLVKTFNLP